MNLKIEHEVGCIVEFSSTKENRDGSIKKIEVEVRYLEHCKSGTWYWCRLPSGRLSRFHTDELLSPSGAFSSGRYVEILDIGGVYKMVVLNSSAFGPYCFVKSVCIYDDETIYQCVTKHGAELSLKSSELA